MGLTGLQIYKYLPKTNCGDCGIATCMAFALALAGNKKELTHCPHLSGEARNTLEEASTPPIKLVAIGTGDNQVELGRETELFRHDKTFYHPTAIAVLFEDDLPPKEFEIRVKQLNNLTFERVGIQLKIEMAALRNRSGDAQVFAQKVKLLSGLTSKPLVLISSDLAALRRGLEIASSRRPLLYAAQLQNWEAMGKLALEFRVPLAVKGESLEILAELTEKLKGLGVSDLLLEAGDSTLAQLLFFNVQIRSLALNKHLRSLGYPVLNFIEPAPSVSMFTTSTLAICKYGGLLITPDLEVESIYPLLTLRQNIYTDPQKPIQVEAKLYTIGNPGENSPLVVTTNFSLTYFMVAGEIEASKIPAYLLVVDTEGTSVLTAWAADKFNGKIIASALRRAGLENLVKHRKLLIPGYVSVISGEVEKESAWQVVVGPKEAAGLPAFLKTQGAVWE